MSEVGNELSHVNYHLLLIIIIPPTVSENENELCYLAKMSAEIASYFKRKKKTGQLAAAGRKRVVEKQPRLFQQEEESTKAGRVAKSVCRRETAYHGRLERYCGRRLIVIRCAN